MLIAGYARVKHVTIAEQGAGIITQIAIVSMTFAPDTYRLPKQ
jgi:hypothetical protein